MQTTTARRSRRAPCACRIAEGKHCAGDDRRLPSEPLEVKAPLHLEATSFSLAMRKGPLGFKTLWKKNDTRARISNMKERAWVSVVWRGMGAIAVVACVHGKAWALQSRGCVTIADCRVAAFSAPEGRKPPALQRIAQAQPGGLLSGHVTQPAQSGAIEVGSQPREGLLAGAPNAATSAAEVQSQVVPEPGQPPRGLLAGAIRGNEAAPGGTGVAAPSGRGLLAGAIRGN